MKVKRYVWPKGGEPNALQALLSSVVVDGRSAGHDYLRIWDRGALAGELTLPKGDGPRWAMAVGLVEDTTLEEAECTCSRDFPYPDCRVHPGRKPEGEQ